MQGRANFLALRERIAATPAGAVGTPCQDVLPLGLAPIDAHLPGGGLARAAVHAVSGAGAFSFLVALLGRLYGSVVWCRQVGTATVLYPHGFGTRGLDPAKLIVAHGQSFSDLLTCAEETLRSGAAGAVVAELSAPIGLTASRRLQLAAQVGGAMGFLLFVDGAARTSGLSAVTVWKAETAPSPDISRMRWRLELVRCRNGRPGTWKVERDAKTDRLAVVPEAGDGQARPAERRRVAG